MKALYGMLIACCFSVAGYSQTDEPGIKQIPAPHILKLPGLLNKPEMPVSPFPNAKLLAENNNGKVYSLPLDNMPCIVADMKDIAAMPAKKLYPGNFKIPNKFAPPVPGKAPAIK